MIKLNITRFANDDTLEMKMKLSVDTTEIKKLSTVQGMITKFEKAISSGTAYANLDKLQDRYVKIAKKLASIDKRKLNTAGKEKVSNLSSRLSVSKNLLDNIEPETITDALDKVNASVRMTFSSIKNTISKIVETSVNMYESAATYIESINLYRMAVGKYAQEGEKWMSRISDALYLDTAQIAQFTGEFFNLTKGLGVTADAADLMSRNLTQLSYDMSSYLNIDVESAQDKLMSALSGQTKAVTSVGIAVQSASLQELAYSLGITKNIRNMTQAEKTYLRYIQIMKTTTQMQGDLGRTIITPTNALRLLKTQFELLARAIGQMLIPIVMKVIPYLVALTEMAREAAKSLASLLGFKASDFDFDYDKLNNVSGVFEDIEEESDNARASINRTLAAFDDLNVVESSSTGVGGTETDTIDFSKYLTGYDMLQNYTNSISDEIDKATKKIKELKPLIEGIVKTLLVIKGISFAANLITNVSTLWDAFKGIRSIFSDGKLNKKIEEVFGTKTAKNVSKVETALKKIVTVLAGVAVGIDGVKRTYDTLADVDSTPLETTTSGLLGTLEAVGGGALAGSAFGPIGTIVGAAVGGLSEIISGAFGVQAAIDEVNRAIAEKNVFGTLHMTTEQWKESLNASSIKLNALYDTITGRNQTIASLGTEFQNAQASLDNYLYRFGYLGLSITETEGPLFEEALKTTFDNAYKIIDEGGLNSLDLYTDLMKKSTSLTEEEQKSILEKVQEGTAGRKKEISDAEDRITTIYNNGIKKRGYLTIDEYNEIQSLLTRIRELTETELSINQTNLTLMNAKYRNGQLKLDKESYDNLEKALDEYYDEINEKAEGQYNQTIANLKRSLHDKAIEEETYQTLSETAFATYNDTITDAQETARRELNDILSGLLTDYESKTKEEQEIINGLLSKFDFDPSEYKKAGEDAIDSFKDGLDSKSLKLTYVAPNTPDINKILTESNYQLGKIKITAGARATGGYVDSGDLFFANENGRAEFITSIGNKAAVANQDQMVNALAQAIRESVGSVGSSQNLVVNLGNKTLYEGQLEYNKQQSTKYGSTKFINV